jgi:hypothetical protein
MNYKHRLQKGLAKPFRSKPYLSWVKAQECPCGAPADDPSHVNVGGYKGMGTKASDLFVWPSCRICHQMYEVNRTKWHDLYGDEWEWVALTIAQAVDEGVIEV